MPFFKENKTILAKKYPKTCKIEKYSLPLQRFWDDESREIRIVLWCNGSTAVFGSACLGSNPGKTTIIKAGTFVSAFIVCYNPSFKNRRRFK